MLEDLLLLLQVLQVLQLLLNTHFCGLAIPNLLLEHELVGHLLLILLLRHRNRHHGLVMAACSYVLPGGCLI